MNSATVQATITVSGPDQSPQSASATGSLDFTTETGQFSSRAPSGSAARILLVGRTLYQPVPNYPGVPSGKTWLSGSTPVPDTSEPALAAMAVVSGVTTAFGPQVDPGLDAGYLRPFAERLSRLGTSVLDGEPVTGYSLDLSASRLETALTSEGSQDASSQKLRAGLGDLVGASHPIRIWLDAAGRVRRISVRYSFGPSSTSGVNTITYSDFGTSQSVTAPPPAEVITEQQFAALPSTCNSASPPVANFCAGFSTAEGTGRVPVRLSRVPITASSLQFCRRRRNSLARRRSYSPPGSLLVTV